MKINDKVVITTDGKHKGKTGRVIQAPCGKASRSMVVMLDESGRGVTFTESELRLVTAEEIDND